MYTYVQEGLQDNFCIEYIFSLFFFGGGGQAGRFQRYFIALFYVLNCFCFLLFCTVQHHPSYNYQRQQYSSISLYVTFQHNRRKLREANSELKLSKIFIVEHRNSQGWEFAHSFFVRIALIALFKIATSANCSFVWA